LFWTLSYKRTLRIVCLALVPEVEIDAVQTPIFTVRLGPIDAVVDFRQRAPQVTELENVF